MSNEMQARLTGDFKLLVGVNMSVNDYLFDYIKNVHIILTLHTNI